MHWFSEFPKQFYLISLDHSYFSRPVRCSLLKWIGSAKEPLLIVKLKYSIDELSSKEEHVFALCVAEPGDSFTKGWATGREVELMSSADDSDLEQWSRVTWRRLDSFATGCHIYKSRVRL